MWAPFLLLSLLFPCRRRPLTACLPESSTREQQLAFFDEARLRVHAGAGGAGGHTVVFLKGRQHGKANGGDGGRGGDVALVCDGRLSSLSGLRGFQSAKAEPGKPGSERFKRGADAPAKLVSVPPGTIVRCNVTQEILGELREPGDELVVARGGAGGGGNGGSKSKGRRTTASEKPKPAGGGERRVLFLELQVVADVGLLGFPNAGKSTLLSRVTAARPKIANYPFTTLTPNLGVCDVATLLKQNAFPAPGSETAVRSAGTAGKIREAEALGSIVLADIPGLVDGAADGRGLGHPFLRHIRRCRLLLHLLDCSEETEEIERRYAGICKELLAFDARLVHVPQVVVLNKMDDPETLARLPEIMERMKAAAPHGRILPISAATGQGVGELLFRTAKLVEKLRTQDMEIPEQAVE